MDSSCGISVSRTSRRTGPLSKELSHENTKAGKHERRFGWTCRVRGAAQSEATLDNHAFDVIRQSRRVEVDQESDSQLGGADVRSYLRKVERDNAFNRF